MLVCVTMYNERIFCNYFSYLIFRTYFNWNL